jgi:CheY-like chemotaxis protein
MPRLACVVDDDKDVCKTVALSLQALGFDTLEVNDGRRVDAVLSRHAVDVLLVDMIMPEKDGIEVIRDARAACPGLRIVAVSGGGAIGPQLYLDLASHVGADACLTKPFTGAALRAAVG